MAVAFANNWDIILSKLENLLRTEFKGALKVYSGLQNEMESNQYLRLSPISSSLIDYSTTLETREFVIGMVLYFKEPNIKKTGVDNVMRLVSRIETIIANNNSITLPDGSLAYDCKIESSEIEASDSEYLVQFNLKCTHANSIASPTVAITAAEVIDGASSEDATLSLTFKTSHTTTDFATGDVSVTNGSLGSISGSGTTYTATFTPTSGGATTIQVVAGKFTDYSGNKNAASDVFDWTYIEKFISTWTTAGSGDRITIPFVNDSNTINFTIDWGDPNDTDDDTVTAWNQDLDGVGTGIAHTYSAEDAATYTIRMTGTISGLKFNNGGDRVKIKTITNWGTLNISTSNAFDGCANLNVTATNAPTISSTNLSDTFSNCTSLTGIGGDWNVSIVQNMTSMFYNAYLFDQDIGGWDTSACTNMISMFLSARLFDQDISDWNTSNVTHMNKMFLDAQEFNQDLPTDGNKWNVSNVGSFNQMFQNADDFNGNISNWNIKTSGTISFQSFFYGATSFNQDISGWDVSNVTDMRYMFTSCTSFVQPLNAWGSKTGNVTYMQNMFQGASSFNQTLNSWNVSSVADFTQMFYGATSFNSSIGGWSIKTSATVSMLQMFNGASAFNQDISAWDISTVEYFTLFLNGSTLSTTNYNLLLHHWEADNPVDGLAFHGGNATTDTSTGGVDGTAARARLVDNHSWTITDGD